MTHLPFFPSICCTFLVSISRDDDVQRSSSSSSLRPCFPLVYFVCCLVCVKPRKIQNGSCVVCYNGRPNVMGGSYISHGPISVAVISGTSVAPVSEFTWSHMFLLLCTSTSLYTSSVTTSHGREMESSLSFQPTVSGQDMLNLALSRWCSRRNELLLSRRVLYEKTTPYTYTYIFSKRTLLRERGGPCPIRFFCSCGFKSVFLCWHFVFVQQSLESPRRVYVLSVVLSRPCLFVPFVIFDFCRDSLLDCLLSL